MQMASVERCVALFSEVRIQGLSCTWVVFSSWTLLLIVAHVCCHSRRLSYDDENHGPTAFQQRNAFDQKVEEREGRPCFLRLQADYRWRWSLKPTKIQRPIRLIEEIMMYFPLLWVRVSQEAAWHRRFPPLAGYRAKTLAFEKCRVSTPCFSSHSRWREDERSRDKTKSQTAAVPGSECGEQEFLIYFVSRVISTFGKAACEAPWGVRTCHVYNGLFQVHCVKHTDGSQILNPSLGFIYIYIFYFLMFESLKKGENHPHSQPQSSCAVCGAERQMSQWTSSLQTGT